MIDNTTQLDNMKIFFVKAAFMIYFEISKISNLYVSKYFTIFFILQKIHLIHFLFAVIILVAYGVTDVV